jgi:hypothetical protein
MPHKWTNQCTTQARSYHGTTLDLHPADLAHQFRVVPVHRQPATRHSPVSDPIAERHQLARAHHLQTIERITMRGVYRCNHVASPRLFLRSGLLLTLYSDSVSSHLLFLELL